MVTEQKSWSDTEKAALLEVLQQVPRLKKNRISIFYQFGLLLVSAAMIILPLIYFAIIVALGFGLYYHAVYHLAVFSSFSSKKAAAVVYIIPLICGGVLFLFLIKPLFAGKAKRPVLYKVNKDDEPFLFNFIYEIARIVGSPPPKEIQLNTDVNASASFRRGILSFIFSNDLVLTIGLPLLEGLSLQQLTGVIAHEFGHFSQGSAMRLTYIIRSISGWFADLVYKRDALDEELYMACQSDDGRAALLAYLIRFLVWIARRVLWVLMAISHGISCFMVRQMEYDADRCEILLEGSENFKVTSERFLLLSIAYQFTINDVITSWQQEGRLVDNWGNLVRINLEKLPEKEKELFLKEATSRPTGFFDTHPSDMARIKAAEKLNKPCLFHTDCPCAVLFNNLNAVAIGLSLDLYHQNIDPSIEMSHLISSEDVLARKEESEQNVKTIARYFQCQIPATRAIQLPTGFHEVVPSIAEISERITQARDSIKQSWQHYIKFLKQIEEKHRRLVELKSAKNQMEADMMFTHNIGLEQNNLNCVRKEINLNNQDKKAIDDNMLPFENQAVNRIIGALQVLFSDEVELDDDLIALRHEVLTLLPAYNFISSHVEPINEFSHQFAATYSILNNMPGQPEERTLNKFWDSYDKTRDALRKFLDEAQPIGYPFDHTDEEMTLKKYFSKEFAERDDLQGTYYMIDSFLNNYYQLHYRLLARLVTIAEDLETALGFEPFEQPPEKADDTADPQHPSGSEV